MTIITPRDEDEVLAAVRAALDDEAPVEVLGHGSKRGLGHAVAAGTTIDTSGLSGIIQYEPSELVLQARPGTPLADIMSLLDAHDQELAFEPMDPTVLWRGNSSGTLGGTVAVQRRWPAPHQGRRRARPPARVPGRVGARRDLQVRRPGHEERHRLRPVEAAGRLLRHTRDHDGAEPQGAAQGRDGAHRAAARPRRGGGTRRVARGERALPGGVELRLPAGRRLGRDVRRLRGGVAAGRPRHLGRRALRQPRSALRRARPRR